MSKLFIVAEVRDWLNQLGNEEISFSKFVELFNEKAASQPYPRWVNGNKRLPSISNEDFPKEYLIRVKGDDPRSGWVHTEYITAESMRDIKEDWWEWLEETPSSIQEQK